MPQSRSIAETASFLRFAFFKSDMLFFIARTVLKRRPFSRVVQEIRGKILQSAPRFTSSHHKVDWLSSYFHACHDEITYFNRGVFPIRLP